MNINDGIEECYRRSDILQRGIRPRLVESLPKAGKQELSSLKAGKMLAPVVESSWSTLLKIYQEFSLESTIHGIKYTTTAKSTCARFFWVVVVIGCLLTAMEFAKLFYSRHQSASMRTLVISEQFPTSQLALPAITLCSGSLAVAHKVVPYLSSQKRIFMPRGVSRADFEHSIKYLRETVYPKNHYPDELDKLQQILTVNRLSVLDLLEAISPNCSDFVILCRFEGRTVPCDRLIQTVVTHYGICCAFNYHVPRETEERTSGESKPSRSAIFGDQYILSVLIKPVSLNDRISSILHGNGFKVIVHEKHTQPTSAATEFAASAGYETTVRLSATLLTSSKEILSLPAKTRNCGASTPGHIYRADNCYLECRESAIRKLCGCVRFSSTSIDNRDQICNLEHTACLARIVLKMNELIMNDPQCNCLPDCESTTYDVSISGLPLVETQHHPRALYQKAREIENASLLHFTFAEQSATWQRKELMLSQVNMISSLGGVFGLFLGCSFISLVEIIYYVVIHVIRKLQSMRNVWVEGN